MLGKRAREFLIVIIVFGSLLAWSWGEDDARLRCKGAKCAKGEHPLYISAICLCEGAEPTYVDKK